MALNIEAPSWRVLEIPAATEDDEDDEKMEDCSEEAYLKRHAKPEAVEKQIIRWHSQWVRQQEYNLRMKDAELRKAARQNQKRDNFKYFPSRPVPVKDPVVRKEEKKRISACTIKKNLKRITPRPLIIKGPVVRKKAETRRRAIPTIKKSKKSKCTTPDHAKGLKIPNRQTSKCRPNNNKSLQPANLQIQIPDMSEVMTPLTPTNMVARVTGEPENETTGKNKIDYYQTIEYYQSRPLLWYNRNWKLSKIDCKMEKRYLITTDWKKQKK